MSSSVKFSVKSDPLGLISPIIIREKMLFQEATCLGLSWDIPVPLDLSRRVADVRVRLESASPFIKYHKYLPS